MSNSNYNALMQLADSVGQAGRRNLDARRSRQAAQREQELQRALVDPVYARWLAKRDRSKARWTVVIVVVWGALALGAKIWDSDVPIAKWLRGPGACGFIMQARDQNADPVTGRIDKRESFTANQTSLRFPGGP